MLDERTSFIAESLVGAMPFAELCRRYGVSRRIGYKWLGRYAAEGPAGLHDRSRAAHHHPGAVSVSDAAAIVAVRVKYPYWGAKKIRAWLREHRGEQSWPVESTISELLDRRGLVKHRRRRRLTPPGAPLSACAAANDVWGIDFKGWFRTGDGRRCDPLSVSDLATRYVVRVQAFERIDGEAVWPVLDAAFREFGPPLVMRSDNGAPFASTAAGGLSRLAVRLVKAGIRPERIEPGRPQQNGRHERMHLTLKAETASPPAANLRQQQRRFDAFRRVFNEERPHEALGQTPPARHYHPPPRRYSGRLRTPDYADGTLVRRVRLKGEIKWRSELVFVSRVLVGEPVGLEPLDDGHWRVHFGPVTLGLLGPDGRFETRTSRWGPACGFVDSAEEALPTTPQAQPPPQAE